MARTVSWFVRARQEDMRQAWFALAELCALPIPPDWPQFGIELAAGWARRGWQGAIAHTRLRERAPPGGAGTPCSVWDPETASRHAPGG